MNGYKNERSFSPILPLDSHTCVSDVENTPCIGCLFKAYTAYFKI